MFMHNFQLLFMFFLNFRLTPVPVADLIKNPVVVIADQFEDLSVNGEKKDCKDEGHQEQGDSAVVN